MQLTGTSKIQNIAKDKNQNAIKNKIIKIRHEKYISTKILQHVIKKKQKYTKKIDSIKNVIKKNNGYLKDTT